MLQRSTPLRPLLMGTLLLALAACQPAGGPAQAQANAQQNLRIQFAAQVNGADFSCQQSYEGVGLSQSTLTPRDFRFYVHNLELINSAGQAIPVQLEQDGKWQHQNLALLDFEDKTGQCSSGTAETRMEITGQVPAGTYKGLRFSLGVPFELNHIDMNQAPSPLNLSALFWNWRFGYKFTRLDFASTGQAKGYAIHLGSTGCTGEMRVQHGDEDHSPHQHAVPASESQTTAPAQCSYANRPVIDLPDFVPGQHQIVADLGHLLAQSDIDSNHENTPSGCMSGPDDPDCQGIFTQLGLPFGSSTAGTQQFFRLIP